MLLSLQLQSLGQGYKSQTCVTLSLYFNVTDLFPCSDATGSNLWQTAHGQQSSQEPE